MGSNILNDLHCQGSGVVQILFQQGLFFCMGIGHADTEDGAGYAIGVVEVGIAATAGFNDFYREPKLFGGRSSDSNDGGIGRQHIRIIGMPDLHLDFCIGLAGPGFKNVTDFLGQCSQFFFVATAGLSSDFDEIRDDVGGTAATDFSDIAGGFFINSCRRQFGDDMGGGRNGIDAIFRGDAGMRGFSLDFDKDLILAGCPAGDFSGMSTGIKGIAEIGFEQTVIHEVEVERISSGRPHTDKQQPVASVSVASREKMGEPISETELRPVIVGGEKISAPMPGKILSVEVAEGQTVKRGDNLLILEAMKMQNEIKAPRDGVIKSLYITAGKAVTSGEVLLTLE